MVIKKCVICGKEFDAKTGTNVCSEECKKIRQKKYSHQYYQNNKNNKKSKKSNTIAKCVVCGKEFKKKTYNNNTCSEECYKENKKNKNKISKKKWYEKNKKRILKERKQYYQDNKKEINDKNKKYREKNKEKIKESNKKWYQKNKEKRREYIKQWVYNNPQYYRQKYDKAYKNLCRLSKVSVEDLKNIIPPMFTQREAECFNDGSYFFDLVIPVRKRANGRCEVTGKKTNDLFIHHLDGYNWCIEKRMDWNNVVVICRDLHNAYHSKYGKGNNTAEQFWEFVEEWEKNIVTLDDFK